MSAGDPNAIYKHETVRVQIVAAQLNTYWYANMIGQVIKADKTTTTYTDKPDVYIKYSPVGDRSKHLFAGDVEEVIDTPRLPRKSNKRRKR